MESKEKKPKGQSVKEKPAKPGSSLPLLLLCVMVLAACAYTLFLVKQQSHSIQSLNSRLNKSEGMASTQATNQETGMQTIEKNYQALRSQLDSQKASLQMTSQRVAKLSESKGPAKNTFLYEEAAHLLRLAQLERQFNPNPQALKSLLMAVDAKLKIIAEPKVLPLRQAISEKLNQINALPPVDLAGILTQLKTVNEAIKTWPLISPLKQQTPPTKDTTIEKDTPATTTPATQKNWRHLLDKSFQSIQKVVVIRHQTQQIKPLLSLDEQLLLQRSQQLFIDEAQWAAIRGNTPAYKASLERLKTSILMHYCQDAPTVKASLETIKTLNSMPLTISLPPVADLLATLEKETKRD